MPRAYRQLLLPLLALASAVLTVAAPARAAPARAEPISPVADCAPTMPCSHPLPVRVVVVTMFEIGADTGDAPGEFQLWKERRHLDTRIPFPQGYHDLWYDPATQTLGMVTGMGSIKSATAVLALGLDPRFDLTRAYWLIAGIAGIDPARASIGSAAWAHYLVDGDMAHEIDPRELKPGEIPGHWSSGYFPIHADPGKPAPNPAPNGEMFELNPGLAHWAYGLTKSLTLPDVPGLAQSRAPYPQPAARRPPFVLEGDQLAAMTYWHGALMNRWAQQWVQYWTRGKGTFVTSAMEETGSYQSLLYLDKVHRADKNRVMVLRAGSNYTTQPPGLTAAQNLARENKGYAGMHAALESLYLVGSTVVDEIESHWDKYEKAPPG